MSNQITSLTLRGFKSIREIDRLEFKSLNILIGANGAGKSNLLGFFRLLRSMVFGNLQVAVAQNGGSNRLLHHGSKRTQFISFDCELDSQRYAASLRWTLDDRLVFEYEAAGLRQPDGLWSHHTFESGHLEAEFPREAHLTRSIAGVYRSPVPSFLSELKHYHFNDSSSSALIRLSDSVQVGQPLASDGSNLASFLLWVRGWRQPEYTRIRDTIRLVAPFFDDFVFEPITSEKRSQVMLEWRQRESDFHKMHPSQLSDGTLRFICLATALLQPEPPTAIILDEPELGLHPYAINILASLLKEASQTTQVIVSTQSPALLDHFEPEDIIVVDHDGQESKFRRLGESELTDWLEDYSLGQLWRKNVFGGGPHS